MLRNFGVMRGAIALGLGGLAAVAASPTIAHADIETQNAAVRPPAPFPGAIARTVPGGTSTPVTTASCGRFPYEGGPVISNVKVVAVFWGSSVDSLVKTTMPGFFSAITASPFLDMLSEYSTTGQSGGTGQTVGRGSLVTSVTITPMVETGATVQDTKIGTELQAQISAGVLPAATLDAQGYPDTLYFLFFPSNVSVVQGGAASCTSWCGYHSSYSSGGKQVPYAVIPDMSPNSECSSGCGGGTEANFVESTAAHELAEAITDTAVGANSLAWYLNSSNCGEIGDVCATGSSSDQATVSGYTVQKVWSNALDACAADNPNVTVSGCTTSSSCSGSTPVCNTTTGACVQCGSSSDCSASAPVCNTTAGTCGPCTSNSQCTNASDPVCTNGTCGPASSSSPDAGTTSSPDASTGGSPDASTGGSADSGTGGLHDASTGSGGSDGGSSYGGYGDDSGSTGSGNQGDDGGAGAGNGDNGGGWSDTNGNGSSGGCSLSSGSNGVSYSGLGIACVAGAMLVARSRRSKRR